MADRRSPHFFESPHTPPAARQRSMVSASSHTPETPPPLSHELHVKDSPFREPKAGSQFSRPACGARHCAQITLMLLITPIMHAHASLLGAFVRAGLATVNFPLAHHALPCRHGAKAAGTGTFGLIRGLLDHQFIIARKPPLPPLPVIRVEESPRR